MPDDIDKHIAEWETLINSFLAHRDRVLGKIPSLHYSDVRVGLYGLTGNALVTGLLTLKMVKTTLLHKQWWQVNVPYVPEQAKCQHQTDELIVHSKIGVFVLFFSFYESTVRTLLRAVCPGACNNGSDAFANVYTCLLTHLGLKQHISLLDFARTIRNLIHNNGMYLHKSCKNETLSFRGKTYLFEHGKKIQFAYLELLMAIYADTLKLSDDLNAHPEVLSLPA